MADAESVLTEVAGQAAECTRCKLNYSRKRSVPGEGPARAQIMLIGEGPGFYENEQGKPFVGASGSFLDELLQKAGLKRKDVFITNVVKCRPPGNRDPLPEELQACAEFLDRQIAAINPLIVITLGRYSMSKFLPNAKITEMHGKPSWVRGRMIVPMFHPAAALHQPSLIPSVEQDFARLPEYIKQARKDAKKYAGGQSDPSAIAAPSENEGANTGGAKSGAGQQSAPAVVASQIGFNLFAAEEQPVAAEEQPVAAEEQPVAAEEQPAVAVEQPAEEQAAAESAPLFMTQAAGEAEPAAIAPEDAPPHHPAAAQPEERVTEQPAHPAVQVDSVVDAQELPVPGQQPVPAPVDGLPAPAVEPETLPDTERLSAVDEQPAAENLPDAGEPAAANVANDEPVAPEAEAKRPEAGGEDAADGSLPAQQSLFGSLFDDLAPAKPKPNDEPPLPKAPPTQLSLF